MQAEGIHRVLGVEGAFENVYDVRHRRHIEGQVGLVVADGVDHALNLRLR